MKRLIQCIVVAAVLAVASVSFAQHAHAKITAAQAQKVALKKYPGKVMGKVVLENEDGKWQYAVNIKSGKKLREVMVDGNTGKIASVEVTSAKEEAKEKAKDKAKAKGKAKGKPKPKPKPKPKGDND